WEAADWDALRAALKTTDWGDVLHGDANQQVRRLTQLLHALQPRWVPHSDHKTKASDQPWFGPACRSASDAKHRAWRALKRHPTARNSYGLEEEAAANHDINATLSRVAAWGRKWQVKFAAHKTQQLTINRTSRAPRLTFNGETLTPRDEVEVLGVITTTITITVINRTVRHI
ncbi:hypothetical protein O3P69_011735, partial [Scylla paramamosain]